MMFITIRRPTLGGRLSYISGRVSYNNIHLSYWSGRLSCLSGCVSGMINFEMKKYSRYHLHGQLSMAV